MCIQRYEQAVKQTDKHGNFIYSPVYGVAFLLPNVPNYSGFPKETPELKFRLRFFFFFFFFVQPQFQSRSQSFVPLDQRSENVSSGSNHYERTKEITEFWLSGSLRTEFWLSGSLRICIYGACLKWLLPELTFSDRWSRGTKLWERDFHSLQFFN